jgi:hypothetical protein
MTDPSASVRNAVVPFNPERDWSGANGTSGLVGVLWGIHRWLGISFPQTQVVSRIRLVSLMVAAEIWLCFWFHSRGSAGEPDSPRDTGYRGVWYANQPSGDEYRYKYSGGFGTYPHQTLPCAIHAAEVGKTFFCYSGWNADQTSLLHLVGTFDHATGRVSRPTIVLDKRTTDAHDNPTLMIDDAGYLWVFSASHGTARPSFIHRSREPWSTSGFEQILETNFSYPHPWWLPGRGFLFLQTRYGKGRGLFQQTSRDGRTWSQRQPLAHIEQGDYQLTWRHEDLLGTVFDHHPAPVGLNARANIYYTQTRDAGVTWETVEGAPLRLPLTEVDNPARIYDSRREGLLVYLKDLNYDREGRPVVLYLTAKGFESGPRHGLRNWYTLHWTGKEWRRREVTTSDHNYDHGFLAIDSLGNWRMLAPTDPGPQPWTTGGELVLWSSVDEGESWRRERQVTRGSRFNHTYARRPVGAHPQFWALWADGNPLESSDSCLYFTTQAGDGVWRLPRTMSDDWMTPERVE